MAERGEKQVSVTHLRNALHLHYLSVCLGWLHGLATVPPYAHRHGHMHTSELSNQI